LREAASEVKLCCGLSAFSRYCRSLIFRPPSSSRSAKSRTTHMKLGKCSASASSSWPPPETPPPPLATNRAFFPSFPCDDSAFATALVAAFDRTWMCFVRFTTSAKSSSAFPSMTPREFQTNIDDRSSASEKICESSDWVRLVDPSPSVSTNSTVVPSSSETGVPHSHNPLVHAFTVAPT